MNDFEQELLEQAKESNKHWYAAMMKAAAIMAERRKKYSGDLDPYANFILHAMSSRITVEDAIRSDIALKLARLTMNTGDFEDESSVDTAMDSGNYSFILAGWLMRTDRDKALAILSVMHPDVADVVRRGVLEE